MSHLRRVQGRFMTTASSEAYQRQLTAPVNKWKKQWIVPTGLQPESSYKICKWVRISERADFADQDEGNDQDDGPLEDDEQEGEQDGDEGAEDGADEEDGTKPPSPTDTPAAATPATALAAPKIIINDAASPTPTPAAASAADIGVPTATVAEPIADAITTHPHDTVLPSNAIEISNEAPLHTETGGGDLGIGAGVEVKSPELGGPRHEAMDVDMAPAASDAATLGAKDEGLVMGEMEAPVDAMEVEGEKKEGPPEAE